MSGNTNQVPFKVEGTAEFNLDQWIHGKYAEGIKSHITDETNRTIKAIRDEFAGFKQRLASSRESDITTTEDGNRALAVAGNKVRDADTVVKTIEAKNPDAVTTTELKAAEKAVEDARLAVEKVETLQGHVRTVWDVLGMSDDGKSSKRIDDVEKAQLALAEASKKNEESVDDLRDRVVVLESKQTSFNTFVAFIAFAVVTFVVGAVIVIQSGWSLGLLFAPVLGAVAFILAGTLVKDKDVSSSSSNLPVAGERK